MLDETCRQLAEWDHLLGPAAPPRANVNVSALQLDDNLPGQVAAALERHGLDPSRISGRDHRVGPDEGPGVGAGGPAAAARPRRRAGHRRLRHRLLVAGLPPAPAGRLPQGGPLLRRRAGRRPRRDRLGRHRAGPQPSTSAPSPRGSRRLEQAEELARLGADLPAGLQPRQADDRRARRRLVRRLRGETTDDRHPLPVPGRGQSPRRCSTSSASWRASTRWPPSARSPRRSCRSPTPTTPTPRRWPASSPSDVALASRVMKLANSAYFGMRGRVTSLQFAVTVVGFTTVRTMATVALTNLDDESRLPENFWDVHDEPRAGRLHPGAPLRRAPAGLALPGPARPDGRRAAAPQRPRGLRGDPRRRADLSRPAGRRDPPLRAQQPAPDRRWPWSSGASRRR